MNKKTLFTVLLTVGIVELFHFSADYIRAWAEERRIQNESPYVAPKVPVWKVSQIRLKQRADETSKKVLVGDEDAPFHGLYVRSLKSSADGCYWIELAHSDKGEAAYTLNVDKDWKGDVWFNWRYGVDTTGTAKTVKVQGFVRDDNGVPRVDYKPPYGPLAKQSFWFVFAR